MDGSWEKIRYIDPAFLLGLVAISAWYGNVLGYLLIGWVVSASGEYSRLIKKEKLLLSAIFFPTEFTYHILVRSQK